MNVDANTVIQHLASKIARLEVDLAVAQATIENLSKEEGEN